VFRAPTVLRDKSEKKFPSFSLLAMEAALAKPARSVEVIKAGIMMTNSSEVHCCGIESPSYMAKMMSVKRDRSRKLNAKPKFGVIIKLLTHVPPTAGR
jgi:hypothetical protein